MRGWTEYIKITGSYDPLLDRTFYAAMILAIFNRYYTVVVRGVTVRMSMQDICDHYQVAHPADLGMTYEESLIPGVGQHETHSSIIASSLKRNGRGYEVQNDVEIRKGELHYDLALWMMFVKYSLKPSSHHTYADPHVACILYCIQHSLSLNIGHIIQLEIMDARAPRERGILPLPSCITHFCQAAGYLR